MQVPGADLTGGAGRLDHEWREITERHETPLLARLLHSFVGFVLQVVLFLSAQMLDLWGSWCILYSR